MNIFIYTCVYLYIYIYVYMCIYLNIGICMYLRIYHVGPIAPDGQGCFGSVPDGQSSGSPGQTTEPKQTWPSQINKKQEKQSKQ